MTRPQYSVVGVMGTLTELQTGSSTFSLCRNVQRRRSDRTEIETYRGTVLAFLRYRGGPNDESHSARHSQTQREHPVRWRANAAPKPTWNCLAASAANLLGTASGLNTRSRICAMPASEGPGRYPLVLSLWKRCFAQSGNRFSL